MKSEIQYLKNEIPSYFYESLRKEYGYIESWILDVVCSLEKKEHLEKCWKKSSTDYFQKQIKNRELFDIIYHFGDEIGSVDIQSQMAGIDHLMRSLENEIMNIKAELPLKKKLYLWLGIMAGLFVFIILI